MWPRRSLNSLVLPGTWTYAVIQCIQTHKSIEIYYPFDTRTIHAQAGILSYFSWRRLMVGSYSQMNLNSMWTQEPLWHISKKLIVRKQCSVKHCVQHVSIQFQCKGGFFKNSGKSGIFELDLANSTSENYLTLFQDQEEFRHSFLFSKEGNNAVQKNKS